MLRGDGAEHELPDHVLAEGIGSGDALEGAGRAAPRAQPPSPMAVATRYMVWVRTPRFLRISAYARPSYTHMSCSKRAVTSTSTCGRAPAPDIARAASSRIASAPGCLPTSSRRWPYPS
ncbi:hypothetical protein GCM10020220_007560 [Nonomuraea rubra]